MGGAGAACPSCRTLSKSCNIPVESAPLQDSERALTTIVDKNAIVRFYLPGLGDEVNDTAEEDKGKGKEGDAKASHEPDPTQAAKRAEGAARTRQLEAQPSAAKEGSAQEIQADALTRLRMLDVAQRAKVNNMDMVGEYGTKVSLQRLDIDSRITYPVLELTLARSIS